MAAPLSRAFRLGLAVRFLDQAAGALDSAIIDGTSRDLTMLSTDVVETKSRAELAREAVDYRIQGHDLGEIGNQLGVSAEEVVWLVDEGIRALSLENAVQTRLLDIRRIDLMMSSIFSTAASGDIGATAEVRQLMRLRRILEGSYRPPPPQRARAHDLFNLEARPDLWAIE